MSGLEAFGDLQEAIKLIIEDRNRLLRENKQYKSAFDEIEKLSLEPSLADYGSQSFYYINCDALDEILQKLGESKNG